MGNVVGYLLDQQPKTHNALSLFGWRELPRLISGPKGKELISECTKDSALFDDMVTWRRKLEDEYS